VDRWITRRQASTLEDQPVFACHIDVSSSDDDQRDRGLEQLELRQEIGNDVLVGHLGHSDEGVGGFEAGDLPDRVEHCFPKVDLVAHARFCDQVEAAGDDHDVLDLCDLP
jgi:hypothetical protein